MSAAQQTFHRFCIFYFFIFLCLCLKETGFLKSILNSGQQSEQMLIADDNNCAGFLRAV